ncbi:MAG: hypothetical protein KJ882_03245 [Proteobacteria bacterium]|nr:hypothetical protein [Pseudomonadota bacterium]MBU4009759.1 hypothetical protein [Pseudomonadota bacterium]MBU4036175.1 hypothetical protein [Pseudomonadota bacterium]
MVCAAITPSEVKIISKAIKSILLKDWDPIGIYRASPDDEYDSYYFSNNPVEFKKPLATFLLYMDSYTKAGSKSRMVLNEGI